MVALGGRRWLTTLAVSGCILAIAVGCGRLVVETQALDAGLVPLVAGAALALAALATMLRGPAVCIAGIAAISTIPILPTVSAFQGVDLTAADVFYAGLLVWAAIELVKPRDASRARSPLRGAPTLILLGMAGLSCLYAVVVDSSALELSVVSWLRLLQTISIAFLAAALLRSTRDVQLVLTAVAVAALISVTIGLTGGVEGDPDVAAGRAGGALGPNALGLVAGLLVLMALFGPLGPQLLYRVPLGAAGAAGLAASASVGSIVATCIASVLGLVLMRPERPSVPGLRAVTAVVALACAVGLAFAVASAVRPENLPTSDEFKTSSAWHRTVVGAAGLELAVQNPAIGVGWRRSGLPHVIGDPDVTSAIRARFQGTRNIFFPDAVPTTVHNTYIQFAAEMGFIGLAALLTVLLLLGRDVSRIVRRAPPGTTARRQLWFLAWAAVLILVWLNENPFFGGQVESVLLTVLIGAIAALGRIGLAEPEAR